MLIFGAKEEGALSKPMMAAVLATALALAGCANPPGTGPGPGEGIGTVAGAVGGALVGNMIGGGAGRVAATVAGGLLGGFLGNRVGNALDQNAQQQAYAAQVGAVQSGHRTTWQSGGSNGYVEAGPVLTDSRGTCRNYTHTIYIDGQRRQGQGVACRNPDGTWQIVS
jgi:surface antigen